MGIKDADLEDEFLFQILAAFRRTLMWGKAADTHVLFGVVMLPCCHVTTNSVAVGNSD